MEFDQADLSQIRQIDQLIGLSKQTFDGYFLETIQRFKCIVGTIPDQFNNRMVFNTALHHYITSLKSQKKQGVAVAVLDHYVYLIIILTDQIDQILQHYHLYYHDGNQDTRWIPDQLCLNEPLNISHYEAISRPSSPSPFNRFFIFSTLIHQKGLKWISNYPQSTLELKQFLVGNNQEYELLTSMPKVDRPPACDSENINGYKKDIKAGNDRLIGSVEIKQKYGLSCKNNVLDDFIRWLSFNIDNKIIVINRPDSRIHVVNEGLFLAAPGIFQDYEKDMRIPWKTVQNKLLAKRWHQRGRNNTNFLTYLVKGKNLSKTSCKWCCN